MVLALFLAFLYAVGTSVVLPTPTEAVLTAARYSPAWAVVLVAVAGKTVGAYLTFFIGDRLKQLPRVQVWRRQSRWGRRLLAWGERWVDRFGAPALFLCLLIPGFPDTGGVYLLALTGRRPLAFAVATGTAAAVRLTVTYFGVVGVYWAAAG
ncbi:MAG: VTT domain-containing protein [Candidatus Bipolaricaulaceae bacterium]